MARLSYSILMSLDGYIADTRGKFDWAEPDEEVHALMSELERPVRTFLLGRRMYFVVAPIIVGGGTSAVPSDVRVLLNLLDERRLGNGMVYLHYRTTRAQSA